MCQASFLPERDGASTGPHRTGKACHPTRPHLVRHCRPAAGSAPLSVLNRIHRWGDGQRDNAFYNPHQRVNLQGNP